MNYQEQMKMRERMAELRKQVESLLQRVSEAEERISALESEGRKRSPRKAIL